MTLELSSPSLEIIKSAESMVDPFGSLSEQEVLRDKLLRFEGEMRKQGNQIVIQPVHYFAQGLYAREILIPKDTLLTGKIHLFEHLNIISKGDISVLTENGIKRVKAPATIISKPGIKRLGFAHEDTVWTTIHACSETDVDEVEKLLVVDTFEEYDLITGGGKCLLLP